MARLGLSFRAEGADLDETPRSDESPRHTARRLAEEKAAVVADRRGGYVIGADQTIALDGRRFHKPGTPERAVEQLTALSGGVHDLWCAVALVDPDGNRFDACVHFEMAMRELAERDIRSYVSEETPVDCAGAYKIEAGGIRLFRSMEGDDYTAIVGLPLTRVWKLLELADYFADPPHRGRGD